MSPKNIGIFLVAVILVFGGLYLLNQNMPQINLQSESSQSTSGAGELSAVQSMPEDLKIEDIKVGEGAQVKNGDTVVIDYLGTLLDGKKFDSSYDRGQPFETQIGVGQVIKGWDLGVIGMKAGGKRKLTIPPELGYGERGAGEDIPPNSTLVFEVELREIK